MSGKRDTRPYKIIIDVHEKDNAISRILLEKESKRVEIKTGVGYDPTGDYVIVDRAGNEWGIERKSFLDCWSSICERRVDGQIAQLIKKYPGRAILMLETAGHFPRNLMSKQWLVRKTVHTFFNDRAMLMPCWMVISPEHAAAMMIKFAKNAHHLHTEGRGIVVIRDESV